MSFRLLTRRNPKAIRKLVENKANGAAVEDSLKKEIPGIDLVEPQGGKESRANAVAPLFDSGNVYLPDPSVRPWAKDVLAELLGFPNAPHDDDVDAMTQALVALHSSGFDAMKRAMERQGM